MGQPINHRLRLAGHLGLRSPDGPLFAHSARSAGAMDQLDFLAEQGFAGVFDIFFKTRPEAEQAALGARMAELGLVMGTFNNDLAHWDQPLWSRQDAAAQEIIRQSVETSIAAMQRAGGGQAVCVTGFDSELSRSTQLEGMIANLRRVAPMAEDAGLTLLVEPVAPDWIPGLLVDNLPTGAAIVDAVASPAVRLIADVGHMVMMGDPVVEALNSHWDQIGCIQIADIPGRVEPGAGTIDWLPIFSTLAERDYQGLVEVELLTAQDSAAGEAHLLANLRRIDTELKERNT